MTPLARGILSSGKLGAAGNFANYNMSKFDPSYGIETPDDVSLDMTNGFSGCAWVYQNTAGSFQYIMSKYLTTGNQISWAMYINDSGNLTFQHSVDGTAITFFTSTINIPVDTLTLAHFRLTGGTLYLGINADAEQSTAKGACFSGTSPVEVGKIDVSTYDDDFDITQVMLFNSGLSAANFSTIYNGGKPCEYSLIDTAITNNAVMAFELSSNDTSLTDLSTLSNDGAFVGGSFVNGQLITWKVV